MTNISIDLNNMTCMMQRAIDALMIDCAAYMTDDRIIDIIDTCDYDDSLIAYALCDIIDNIRTLLDIDDDELRRMIAATRTALTDII